MDVREKYTNMEIRRCGNSWVCCDGECDKCKANKIIYTDRAQPPKVVQLWLNAQE